MILLMGLPGAGKGTQGALLVQDQGMRVISTGDLVRKHVTGKRMEEVLAGKYLNDQEMIELLDTEFTTVTDFSKIILDGFPRTVPQIEWLSEQTAAGRFSIDAVVFLTVSYDAVKERLLGRGRPDDTAEVIKARFNEYDTLTQPVLDWFDQHGVPVLRISGEGTIEDIHTEIVRQLQSL